MQEGKGDPLQLELCAFLHGTREISSHLFGLCLCCNSFHSLLFLIAENVFSKFPLSDVN